MRLYLDWHWRWSLWPVRYFTIANAAPLKKESKTIKGSLNILKTIRSSCRKSHQNFKWSPRLLTQFLANNLVKLTCGKQRRVFHIFLFIRDISILKIKPNYQQWSIVLRTRKSFLVNVFFLYVFFRVFSFSITFNP